jgi:hypothetical protein
VSATSFTRFVEPVLLGQPAFHVEGGRWPARFTLGYRLPQGFDLGLPILQKPQSRAKDSILGLEMSLAHLALDESARVRVETNG